MWRIAAYCAIDAVCVFDICIFMFIDSVCVMG